jgi:hypothetical protein
MTRVRSLNHQPKDAPPQTVLLSPTRATENPNGSGSRSLLMTPMLSPFGNCIGLWGDMVTLFLLFPISCRPLRSHHRHSIVRFNGEAGLILLLELERGRKTVGCSSEQTWGGGGGVGHGRGCLDPVVIGLGGGRRKDVTKKERKKERKKGGAIRVPARAPVQVW